MRRPGSALLVALALAGGTASHAHAAPPRAPDDGAQASAAQGLELASQAAAAYKEGRFEEAITLYQRAHELSPDPIAIHNIGRCHEAIGYRELGDTEPGAAAPEKLRTVTRELRAAIDHYERYLAAEPEAASRGVVEQRIRALEAQLKLLENLAAKPKDEGKPPEPEPRSTLRVAAPWIVVGVGTATLATALVFSGMASSSESEANDPATSGTASLDAADDATTFATTANVLFAVGGAIALAGGVWAVVDLTSSPSTSGAASASGRGATQLRVGPGGVGVARSF